MTFADVDNDGVDELVVATESTLQVFEGGSDTPTTSAREMNSLTIDAMVAGDFDDTPGEDIVIELGDDLLFHPSMGANAFSSPNVLPSPLPGSIGLLAGEFDGRAPSELLSWGPTGAVVDRGAGDLLWLTHEEVVQVTAQGPASPNPGFSLKVIDFIEARIEILSLDAELIVQTWLPYYAVVAVLRNQQESVYVSAEKVNLGPIWTLMEVLDPLTGDRTQYWAFEKEWIDMTAGDLDGDGAQDLVLRGPLGNVVIHFDPLGPGSCVLEFDPELTGHTTTVALGDLDGDGDDEVALLSVCNDYVLLLDAE